MGDLAAADGTFWELFARGGHGWVLLTPPGVATNGGVVGVLDPSNAVTAAVVPSANLRFSPVAATDDLGRTWSTGILPGGIVAAAGAMAASQSGRRLVLLSAGGGTVAVGTRGLSTWTTIGDTSRIAAMTATSGCRLSTLRAVAFGPGGSVVVGGTCTRGVGAPIAVWRRGAWHVGAPVPGGTNAVVLRLAGLSHGVGALVETHLHGKRAVIAAVSPDGLGPWTATPPLVFAAGDTVVSTSEGADGAAIVVVRSTAGTLLAYSTGPGSGRWAALRSLPAHVVDVVAKPGAGFQALAVEHRTMLVVFDATRSSWRVVQRLVVPISFGSSS